jgi:hypothetical protein
MTTPVTLAGFLGALRQRNRAVPMPAAEALLLIASGIDNIPDLQQAMHDGEGRPLPPATVNRLISLLRGRARYQQGQWVESPFTLLEVRRHPHRRGLQLQLSEAGIQLMKSYFATYSNSQHPAAHLSTCDERTQ